MANFGTAIAPINLAMQPVAPMVLAIDLYTATYGFCGKVPITTEPGRADISKRRIDMSFAAIRVCVLPLLACSVLNTAALGQLPSRQCDLIQSPAGICSLLTAGEPGSGFSIGDGSGLQKPVQHFASPVPLISASTVRKEHFHWGRTLRESFTFLVIEQAYVVKEDYRWVTAENGVPFNHYWRDYKQSLSTWINSGWNDGDDPLYNYVGHPIQGAMTSFIQIQNDPQGRELEFSNTKAYWWSRFKATLWNAAYSTQWSIGPLSELTVEKYGTRVRQPWNHDGTWPCHEKNCFTGAGQVNLVITPIGGLGWLLAEDLLDKHIARRVEAATTNRFLVNFTRCALNPIRGGANILHGKRPWYRASRDAHEVYFSAHFSRNAQASAILRDTK